MSFDLLRLQPHPNRQSEDEVMVLVEKNSKRSKDESGDITKFQVQVHLLDLLKKSADGFQMVKFSAKPKFEAIADHNNKAVTFYFGEMGSLLPVDLRGGGLGSFILSEMIRWAKMSVPDYGIVPCKVFVAPDEDDAALQRNKAFLTNTGFGLKNADSGSTGSIYGVAVKVEALKVHVNTQKLERVDLPIWTNEISNIRVTMANQVETEKASARFYKDELKRQNESDKGRMSFWAGLMLGLVVGVVIGVVLFSV